MSGKVLPRSFRTQAARAVRGEGVYIFDEDGKRYIDGCSGALISNLGHGNAEIIEAVTAQMNKIEFAHPSRWRCEAVEDAAREVATLTPKGMDYAWFVSGGSEAIESAMKLARQYFVERDGAGSSKAKVLARWNSYHGSTIGTMAVAGSMPRRRIFSPMFQESPKVAPHYCYRCPFGLEYPTCELRCAHQVEEAIKRIGPESIAAFLAEPIVGSTVGALTPPDEYWPIVREICDRYDILLIADEVMTGFGRTGANFCVNHWNVVPDIIASAKGMAAGYVPTGGIMVKNGIAETLKAGSGSFLHGHTYNGNPLSGAATAAVVRYIKKNGLVENVRIQGEKLGKGLKELQDIPIVGQVRGKGFMWGFELVEDRETRRPFPKAKGASALVTQECLKRGLVIYPGGGMADGIDGDNFMIAPPLISDGKVIDDIVSIFGEGLKAASAKLSGV